MPLHRRIARSTLADRNAAQREDKARLAEAMTELGDRQVVVIDTPGSDSHLGRLKASNTLPGFDAVRIPGDRRDAITRERGALGIPLHPNLIKVLSDIAGELKIDALT